MHILQINLFAYPLEYLNEKENNPNWGVARHVYGVQIIDSRKDSRGVRQEN